MGKDGDGPVGRLAMEEVEVGKSRGRGSKVTSRGSRIERIRNGKSEKQPGRER